MKISPVVDTTTDATATTTCHYNDQTFDNDVRQGMNHEVTHVDPLEHWSDVMPTLDLPPPPPPLTGTAALTSSSLGQAVQHSRDNSRHQELETFANDMELLGDFLLDAMADPHHEDSAATVSGEHRPSTNDAHSYQHEVFDVEEELPPPPLMLPPAAAGQ